MLRKGQLQLAKVTYENIQKNHFIWPKTIRKPLRVLYNCGVKRSVQTPGKHKSVLRKQQNPLTQNAGVHIPVSSYELLTEAASWEVLLVQQKQMLHCFVPHRAPDRVQ